MRKVSSFSGTGRPTKFYHLKALITLELVNNSVVKKKKNLYEQTVDGDHEVMYFFIVCK